MHAVEGRQVDPQPAVEELRLYPGLIGVERLGGERLELLGQVPLDIAVRDSVAQRQLLMETLPGCPAALAVAAVATRLLD